MQIGNKLMYLTGFGAIVRRIQNPARLAMQLEWGGDQQAGTARSAPCVITTSKESLMKAKLPK